MTTNILVVDDSHVERLLVEGLLRKNADFRVEHAENGKEALDRLAVRPADVVVTDLVMPDMDGLELVRAARRGHPEIPVILMTAYGDETIAVEALEAGAASYVPKSQRAERLLATVNRVVERAATDRNRERLAQCVLEYHCRFDIENDLGLIRALVDQVQQVMAGHGFGDTVERIRMGEALEEALLNAMYHGNLEIDEHELADARDELDDRVLTSLIEQHRSSPQVLERKIIVVVHLTTKEARFVVRDQGRGFNTAFAPSGRIADRFEGGRHRGMTLMQSLMDDVSYNATGNELTMRKSRQGMETDQSLINH